MGHELQLTRLTGRHLSAQAMGHFSSSDEARATATADADGTAIEWEPLQEAFGQLGRIGDRPAYTITGVG